MKQLIYICSNPEDGASTLSISAILKALYTLGVRSLMVEGGARVIDSFFCAKAPSEDSVVDTLIVTVAPTFIGDGGVGYGQGLGDKVRCVMVYPGAS